MADDDFLSQASNDQYRLLSLLGKGAQGEVYEVLHVPSGTHYACKLYPINRRNKKYVLIGDRGEGISEVHHSLIMDHPNIVKYLKLVVSRENSIAYLIMELADTDLSNFLVKTKLSYDQKVRIMFGIIRAMKYIRDGDYVHCDIKSDNILMSGENPLIADFGITRLADKLSTEGCQTENYRSPETLAFSNPEFRQYFDFYVMNVYEEGWRSNQSAAEIWSIGIVLLEIIYQKPGLTLHFTRKGVEYNHDYPLLIWCLVKNIIVENKTMYNSILEFFGNPSTEADKKLLRLVCDNFLIFDQYSRISRYRDILKNEIFTSRGLLQTDLDRFQRHLINLPMIDPEKETTFDQMTASLLMDNAIKSMREACVNMCTADREYMDAVDFFIQHFDTYVKSKSDVDLFAMTSLYLIRDIENLSGMSTLKETIKSYFSIKDDVDEDYMIPDHNFSIGDIKKDLYEYILDVWVKQEGKIIFESTYEHLPTVLEIYRASYIQTRSLAYKKIGGPSGIVKFLSKYPYGPSKFWGMRKKPSSPLSFDEAIISAQETERIRKIMLT